jgi:hypothetical protein
MARITGNKTRHLGKNKRCHLESVHLKQLTNLLIHILAPVWFFLKRTVLHSSSRRDGEGMGRERERTSPSHCFVEVGQNGRRAIPLLLELISQFSMTVT